MIIVDTGEPAASTESPPATLSRTVEQSLAAGLQSPTARVPDERERTSSAGAADCAAVVLQVSFGGTTLPLKCSEDALWAYVATAFLEGGFSSVVRARVAIDTIMERLQRESRDRTISDDEARDRVAKSDYLYQKNPTPSQASNLDQWRNLARITGEQHRQAKAAAAQARACHERYATLFRDVWSVLAMAEEELLRDYEAQAIPEFQRIAENNTKAAADEWKKYGCYMKDDADKKLVDISVGRESASEIRFTRSDAELKVLYQDAMELQRRAVRISTDRQVLDQAVDAARRGGEDENAQRRFRELAIEDRLNAWRALRAEIGKQDPVLLQIYPRMLGRTSLAEFRQMMVDALIDAFDASSEILKALSSSKPLTSEGQLRVEPKTQNGNPAPRAAYGDASQAIDVGDYWDALERYELTIPASTILANRLRNPDTAQTSVWLHLPVRLAVHSKLAQDDRRKRFTQSGTFEDAVVVHLWDALEELRHHAETTKGNRALLLFAGALVLAPFTAGGSLIAAGLLQAAFSSGEIYDALREYGAADQLARSTLEPMEMALWTRPSTVSLVRAVASRTLDVVGNVVPAGRIPLVIHLALSAASSAIDPAAR